MGGRSAPSRGRLYSWYVLGVLLFTYTVAFLDRQIIAVMVDPIRADLALDDTQISLVLGLAFGLIYAIAGPPIAWLADRYNRRNLVAAGVLLWNGSTAASGLVRSYGEMLTARAGVGLGEAFVNPVAVSLISDYFQRAQLGRAMGVYMLGIPLGTGLASVLGGWWLLRWPEGDLTEVPILGPLQPWRALLLLLGFSGLVVLLLLATVREAVRHRGVGTPGQRGVTDGSGVRDVLAYLARYRVAFFGVVVPLGAGATMTFGIGYWIPSFFARSFEHEPRVAATFIQYWGAAVVIVGSVSLVVGGIVVDRLAARYRDGYWRALMLGMAIVTPCYGLFAWMPTPDAALMLLIPALAGSGLLQAGGVTALVAISPGRIRAQVVTVGLLMVGLCGAALGPTFVALVTDRVFGDPAMLRDSLVAVALFWGAIGIMSLLYCRERYVVAVQEQCVS